MKYVVHQRHEVSKGIFTREIEADFMEIRGEGTQTGAVLELYRKTEGASGNYSGRVMVAAYPHGYWTHAYAVEEPAR